MNEEMKMRFDKLEVQDGDIVFVSLGKDASAEFKAQFMGNLKVMKEDIFKQTEKTIFFFVTVGDVSFSQVRPQEVACA